MHWGSATSQCSLLYFYAEPTALRYVSALNFSRREKAATGDLPTILIVEDDPLIQCMVEEALQEAGFETAIAGSAEEAVTLIKGKVTNYQVLITDINLRGRMTG